MDALLAWVGWAATVGGAVEDRRGRVGGLAG